MPADRANSPVTSTTCLKVIDDFDGATQTDANEPDLTLWTNGVFDLPLDLSKCDADFLGANNLRSVWRALYDEVFDTKLLILITNPALFEAFKFQISSEVVIQTTQTLYARSANLRAEVNGAYIQLN